MMRCCRAKGRQRAQVAEEQRGMERRVDARRRHGGAHGRVDAPRRRGAGRRARVPRASQNRAPLKGEEVDKFESEQIMALLKPELKPLHDYMCLSGSLTSREYYMWLHDLFICFARALWRRRALGRARAARRRRRPSRAVAARRERARGAQVRRRRHGQRRRRGDAALQLASRRRARAPPLRDGRHCAPVTAAALRAPARARPLQQGQVWCRPGDAASQSTTRSHSRRRHLRLHGAEVDRFCARKRARRQVRLRRRRGGGQRDDIRDGARRAAHALVDSRVLV